MAVFSIKHQGGFGGKVFWIQQEDHIVFILKAVY